MTWATDEKGCSQRRACALVGVAPKTYRYAPRRPDGAAVRARLRALAAERRRFGHRRLHVLPRREGAAPNHKKPFRLYREEPMAGRRRGGRKRALGTRAPTPQAAGRRPQAANQRWSLDFASGVLADGRRFRALVVVDDFTRERLAPVEDTSLSGRRVVRGLGRTSSCAGPRCRWSAATARS